MKFLTLLQDPRFLNYVLLALYTANCARQCCGGYWKDGLYWLGALIITTAVTLKHS